MALTGTSSAGPVDVQKPAPAAVIDLRDIFVILKRQAKWVFWSALLCTIIGAIVAYALPTRYTATAQILLDVHGLQVMQGDLMQRADRSSDALISDAESQLQVVSSGSVLRTVVEREKLQDDSEFGGAPPSLLSSLMSSLFGSSEKEDRVLKATRILENRMGTRRPDKSFVIDISVSSKDPAKAARLANAIASVYLEHNFDARTEASKRTTGALESRLAELRDRAARSARRVEEFKEQNKILGANGELINEQQLSALNKQLVQARALTAERRARYEDVKRLQRSSAEPDAIAEAIDSQTITALRSQYAEAKQAEANKTAILGPRHPQVIAAAAQVAQSRRRIDEELSRIADTALSDYNRARTNEEDVAHSLDALKGDVTKTNQQMVRLHELESEAESDRAVYTAFLNRAKEVGEQQDLNNTDSRIITRAVAPTAKSGPPRLLIIAGSLVFGLIGGSMIGLLRDQFNPTVVSARQLAAEFGVRVLAEVPGQVDAPSPVFAPDSPQAAAMHHLVGVLRSRSGADGADVTLITSPSGSPDARSIIALNLAVCAGAAGARVLLVISDPQRYETKPSTGGSALERRGRINFADRVVHTPWRGVALLRLPPSAGYDRWSTDRLQDVIREAADAFDLIVIDDGLSSTESVLLASPRFLDNVIMVVESGQTRRDELQEGLEALKRSRSKLAGAVLAA
jgi:succinoglycan biosynthesis transport protein ExoP